LVVTSASTAGIVLAVTGRMGARGRHCEDRGDG
jgi:hypothetical protein